MQHAGLRDWQDDSADLSDTGQGTNKITITIIKVQKIIIIIIIVVKVEDDL